MRMSRLPLAVGLIAMLGAQAGSAQQKVPFAGGIPVAPLGLANKPLPKLPMEFDTGEIGRAHV